VTADSVPRQPLCRFTISRTPPFRLSFHPCVSRCTGVCPVGSFVERGSSEWSRVRSAAVVLRGFVDLPLFAQGQHYVFYLSCTTGGGGSVSLITQEPVPEGIFDSVTLAASAGRREGQRAGPRHRRREC